MINQVILVGRLTKDPELRYTPDGHAVSNVTIALNRNYKNSNGEYLADFVQCTIWKKAAENTAQFCQKGSIIGITGRIQTRHYNDHEGRKVYITEVTAEHVKFMGNKRHQVERTLSHPVEA